MNNLGKHSPAPGNELAAAFGMTMRAGVRSETMRGYAKVESPVSSQDVACAGDPVRAVVADKLARMIHIGLLEAGDPLPSERSLSELFRVARQSVRAALGILEGRLMLAISHGRRSRVLGPGRLSEVDCAGTLKSLRARPASDIFQVRLVLDVEIATLSAINITMKEIEQLEALVRSMPDTARDALCYQMLDYEISSLIYASCGNRFLADIAMDFYGHASPQRRRLFADQKALGQNTERQASLVKALRERDGQQAALIMRELAEALAALPAQEPGTADDRTSQMNGACNQTVDSEPLPKVTRGVFWPAMSAA